MPMCFTPHGLIAALKPVCYAKCVISRSTKEFSVVLSKPGFFCVSSGLICSLTVQKYIEVQQDLTPFM